MHLNNSGGSWLKEVCVIHSSSPKPCSHLSPPNSLEHPTALRWFDRMCSRTSGTSNRSVLGWHVAEEDDAYHHCIVQQVCSLQFSQVAHSSKLPNVSPPEQPTLDRLLFACAQAKAPCKYPRVNTPKDHKLFLISELNPQNGGVYNSIQAIGKWPFKHFPLIPNQNLVPFTSAL